MNCLVLLLDWQGATKAWFFLIWPINVIRFYTLCFTCTRFGFPLPWSSNKKMQPGDYAVYSGRYLHFAEWWTLIHKLDTGDPKLRLIEPRAYTFHQQETMSFALCYPKCPAIKWPSYCSLTGCWSGKMTGPAKGVAECGKETNTDTHLFFSESCLTPLSPLPS